MSIVDTLIEFLHSLMGMPLYYPLVSLIIIGDALCPLLPSETILNLSGAFSASQGVPNLWGVFTAAVAGAMIGDNLCFALGGKLIGYVERLDPASKAGQAITWVRRNMKRGAGITIIVGRFLPWVRWVATIVLGSVQYRWGAFFFYDTLGVLLWSLIGVGSGYVRCWRNSRSWPCSPACWSARWWGCSSGGPRCGSRSGGTSSRACR